MAGYMRLLTFGVPFEAFTRDIWLICLSNVIGAFGEGLYSYIFPIYVGKLEADYFQIGTVISALYGASALTPLLGGWLADRFDRKKILLLSWIPWFVAPLFYSAATHWTLLIPGTICWGVSMIGVPAVNAYIITSVEDKKKLTSVFSFVWASYSFSYIFAPAAGALLASFIGMRLVFLVSSVLCAVATVVFLFLHSQHPRKRNQETSPPPVLSSTEERRLWHRVLFWAVFFASVSFFAAVGRTFVQTYLNSEVLLSEFYVGLFGSINFAGFTLLGVVMGRLGDRWRKPRAISLCLLFHVVSMLPFLLTKATAALMPVAFFHSGAMIVGSLVSSYVGTVAPENKRGLWVSVPQTLSLSAAFLAPYLSAFLYTQSPYHAFAVSAVSMPFLMLFALTLLKE